MKPFIAKLREKYADSPEKDLPWPDDLFLSVLTDIALRPVQLRTKPAVDGWALATSDGFTAELYKNRKIPLPNGWELATDAGFRALNYERCSDSTWAEWFVERLIERTWFVAWFIAEIRGEAIRMNPAEHVVANSLARKKAADGTPKKDAEIAEEYNTTKSPLLEKIDSKDLDNARQKLKRLSPKKSP